MNVLIITCHGIFCGTFDVNNCIPRPWFTLNNSTVAFRKRILFELNDVGLSREGLHHLKLAG